MPRGPQVTERTFYPHLLKVIESKGGTGVTEVSYNSEPDIEFNLLERRWLLSVKIGETPSIIKSAFLQYLRHKEESGLDQGLLLLLPLSVRNTPAEALALEKVVNETPITVLVDAGPVKGEYRNRPFPDILDLLGYEVAPLIAKGEAKPYPLSLVLSLLREQVMEMMNELTLDESEILRIITDRALLTNVGQLRPGEAENVARFLAAYIILSQILFLRLLASVRPYIITGERPLTRRRLREAFARVLDINYRPVYEIDVLDAVPEPYLRDTFNLIWGLAIENIRYELPGRLFHELMPPTIRKLLAAFYTRPQAAEILARLTIELSEDTVFDPACGSGTILVAAYKEKSRLHQKEGWPWNPHRRFCEDDIFGADIMPFATHLATANLAAMDVSETIERTQVIMNDALRLHPGIAYESGFQAGLFPTPIRARRTSGEEYTVSFNQVKVVLMNPPFTKVERGIRRYVDMNVFRRRAGGEVGLWGHFIFLADVFLENNGMLGAVLPVNLLRGRESKRVRNFLLQEWTPLYLLKPTLNYGFSEWAEYRDIIFVARKQPPPAGHQVKFALIKQNLTLLQEDDIEEICSLIKTENHLRSENLDIHTEPLSELNNRFMNLMWFCGVSDFGHRDKIVSFYNKFKDHLLPFPKQQRYFKEGYRPVPEGVSSFLFLTRRINDARIQEAFLAFDSEDSAKVSAYSHLGVRYNIEKDCLTPTLRTPIGLQSMNITGLHDYIAHKPYRNLRRVVEACGFSTRLRWRDFWNELGTELKIKETYLVTMRRINPYSPNTHLISFLSEEPISPSNMVNIVTETNIDRAKAVCVLLNSCIFLAQFFLLKEESTGRYIDIRFYDLYEMRLYPQDHHINALVDVYQKYSESLFLSLRDQFDSAFEARYEEFWENARGTPQRRLFSVLEEPIRPSPLRVDFDLDVCRALDVPLSERELVELYTILVKEMIITRGLLRD